MTTIASALRDEISRVARKEVRAHTEGIKKASGQRRHDVAELKRRVSELERTLGRLVRLANEAGDAKATSKQPASSRITSAGVLALRKRLDLSQKELGALADVSAQTIYNIEQGGEPRPKTAASLIALRAIGKREARARLAKLGVA